MNKMCRTTNQSGRSMIEMLGVLAIIGVLSVGGIAGYSKAMTKYRINKTIEQISQIVANTRILYTNHTTYEGLNNKTAIQMGIIPDELGTDYHSGILTNSLNGNVFIGAGNISSNYPPLNTAFLIGISKLSREACINIATHDYGTSSSSGIIGIQTTKDTGAFYGRVDEFMNITAIHIGCEGLTQDGRAVACSESSTSKLPMNVAQAAKGCNCQKDTCTITWKYH